MKYHISHNTGATCVITLIPENSADENVLKVKDEFTLLYHYQQALLKIHIDATFLQLLNTDGKINPVSVHYEIASGFGS